MAFYRSTVLVSTDPICVEKGAYELVDAINDELIKQGLIDEVQILETTRLGDPQEFGPDIMIYPCLLYTSIKIQLKKQMRRA